MTTETSPGTSAGTSQVADSEGDAAEAAQAYEPAAREALAAFGVELAELRFVRLSENVTFRATDARDGSLVFDAALRKDRISGWRWLLGAWGVGTYRQNDSVDVRYRTADGSPRLAEALEITYPDD